MFKNEQKHPFYKPLRVRIAVVVTLVLWLAFELYQASSGLWIALAGGMLIYFVYTFFITWPKDEPTDDVSPNG